MKNLGVFLLGCLISGSLYAQTDMITIGLILPEQQEQIDERALRLLSTRMQGIMSNNGISSMQNGNFIMYPIVNILKDELIEGGMKNMAKVEVDLTICIIQYSTQTSFGSFTTNLNGSGKTLQDAVLNAFSKIQNSDVGFTNFISKTKEKISQYYISNQKNILAKAKTLTASKQYEEAISLLYTYPSSIEGASIILDEVISIYKQYQNTICTQWIQEAQGDIALQNYISAIEILTQIDSESLCRKEAISLINYIKTKIQNDIDKQEYLAQKELEMSVSLEKLRINTIKEIAVAYCKNQPAINYTQIIK